MLLGLIASEADEPVSGLQEPAGRYWSAFATGCGLFRSSLLSGGHSEGGEVEDMLRAGRRIQSPLRLRICP